MRIDMLIGQIDLGSFALPEFQRGYVWNRDQVKRLVTRYIGTIQSAVCCYGRLEQTKA